MLLGPYHLERFHALTPADYPSRSVIGIWTRLCKLCLVHWWSLLHTWENLQFPQFPCLVRGKSPFHDLRSHQHRFCVNVWTGIVDDFLLGPYIFPKRLNANIYLILLQNFLPELLHPIPLNIRRSRRFQRDGIPPYFGNAVRGHLTAIFGARWIGRSGPTAWPVRSPDLTCLDFFLWGYIKSMVYETDIDSEENLVACIVSAEAEIRETPGIFGRVQQNMARRCTVCLDVNCREFQHLWWDKKLDPSW